MSVKSPVLNDNGEVESVIGVSVNITKIIKQKQAEARLETMEFLFGVLSHDLATPLASLGLTINKIKKHIEQLLLDSQSILESSLVSANQKKNHLELLNELSTYPSKFEYQLGFLSTTVEMALLNLKKNRAIDTSSFESCSIIEDIKVALLYYPFTEEERSKVHWRVEKGFNYLGDEHLTKYILFNLIKNALFYIAQSGKGIITLRVESDSKTNKVIFSDTGPGIPGSILPHIFDRFFSKRRKGSGLGLAFCKAVMKSYGGDITCQSHEGKFTKFTLLFPVFSY